jgi:hypothetical protein
MNPTCSDVTAIAFRLALAIDHCPHSSRRSIPASRVGESLYSFRWMQKVERAV